MAKKLKKTLADYVVIALSPALIMLLVGSMLYFLLEVSYGGDWGGRLQYIFTLFVFAIVLITRISVEEGLERAMLFGVALAGAVTLVILQFLGLTRGLIAGAFLAFIWWTTHKLTLDCTLIDDEQDSSGEGLLQVTGLDPEASSHDTLFDAETKPVEPAKSVGELLARFGKRILFFDRSKPHPPGAWVLYYALIAIPIFGVGQMMVRSDDLDGRRYILKLAIAFLGALLGLLLTTSFLGLRRYLRQRKLEMPTTMATSWIGVGAGLIVGLLMLAALLPRANPEYSLTGWAKQFDKKPEASSFAIMRSGGAEGEGTSSSDTFRRSDQGQEISGMKPGEQPQGGSPPQESGSLKSATNERPAEGGGSQNSPQQQSSQTNQNGNGQQGQSQGSGGKSGESSSKSGDGKQSSDGKQSGGQSGSGQSSGSNQQSSSQQSSSQQNNSQQNSDQKQGSNSQSGSQQQGQSQGQQQGQSQGQQQGQSQGQQQGNSSEKSGGTLQGQEQSAVKPPNDQANAQQQPSQQQPQPQPANQASQPAPPPAPTSNPLSNMLPSFSTILSVLKWLVLGCVAAYLIIRYWSVVLEALKDFLAGLREFWALLFGKKPLNAVADEEVTAAPVVRASSFSDFRDPFQSGKARKWPPHETLRYTFSALEAWANDRGLSRHEDETPIEFTERLAAEEPAIADVARDLGRLVARVAYGRAQLDRAAIAPLAQAWEAMKSAPKRIAAAAR